MDLLRVLTIVLAAQVSGKEIKTLYTHGYSYSQYFPLTGNLAQGNTLRFSVRTSRDAHIVLAPSPEVDGPVYEVVLGALNNTFCHIRGRYPEEREPLLSTRTVNLLDVLEYRNFWIRIKPNGRRSLIQVGIGDSDTSFQEWLDPEPLIPRYVSFRSGTTAEWKYGYSDSSYTVGISTDTRQAVVTATGYGQYFPLSEVVSHSDNSVTLYFTLQSDEEFQILLSPTVNYLGDAYEFGITGTGVYLSRRHLGDFIVTHQRNGLLTDQERLGFWIRLTRAGELMMGTGGSAVAVLSWLDPNPLSPQFVSFTLYRPRAGHSDVSTYANLQYGLGPEYSLASQDCRPRWKDAVGQRLPPGAVRGGWNNETELFICRLNHEDQLIPGSFAPGPDNKGQCYVVPNDWSVVTKPEFQVLTGCGFSWSSASYGGVPKGSIAGGHTGKNSTLYVARVSHARQINPGKLEPSRVIAFVALYNKIQRPFVLYQLLVNEASGQ